MTSPPLPINPNCSSRSMLELLAWGFMWRIWYHVNELDRGTEARYASAASGAAEWILVLVTSEEVRVCGGIPWDSREEALYVMSDCCGILHHRSVCLGRQRSQPNICVAVRRC